jgi:hypothetical protein
MLERKLETKDWSVRVNLSLFGMCVIDAYYVAKGCRICDETPAQFFEALAEELIDNNYGPGMGTRGQRGGTVTSPEKTLIRKVQILPVRQGVHLDMGLLGTNPILQTHRTTDSPSTNSACYAST